MNSQKTQKITLEAIFDKLTSMDKNNLETEQRLNCAINAAENRIVQTVQAKFAEIDGRLESAESRIESLEDTAASTSQDMLMLQAKTNQHNLLLFNFKEEESDESELKLAVIKFCENSLKVPVFQNDIDTIRRLGKLQDGKDRPEPVLFTLFSLKLRHNF